VKGLDRFASDLYITDNFGGNLNEIHSQISAKFQEYPFEANDVELSLDKSHILCLLLGILRAMKARNSIP